MTQGAEFAKSHVGWDADASQAEYFWRLLDGRKVEVCEALEAELDALAGFQRAGDLAGVRRKRRTVKALEAELRTVDKLLVALRVRLGLPTLRPVVGALAVRSDHTLNRNSTTSPFTSAAARTT